LTQHWSWRSRFSERSSTRYLRKLNKVKLRQQSPGVLNHTWGLPEPRNSARSWPSFILLAVSKYISRRTVRYVPCHSWVSKCTSPTRFPH
jgi:hypothetical protein